jgi:hypothetical protein
MNSDHMGISRSKNRVVLILFLCGLSIPLHAEVKEYQIRRILLYQSDCDVESITPIASGEDESIYKATCQNVSFYPEGVRVYCRDNSNENTCVIEQDARTFDHLQLLQEQ